MLRPDLIIDIGAHTGEDTQFYVDKGFSVVAVEANPTLVDGLKARFASEITKGIVTIEPFALGDSAGTVSFFVHKSEAVFSTLKIDPQRQNSGDFDEIKIRSIPASSVFRRHGTPYYLKIDIEGGELAVVRSLEQFSKPKYLSFEVSKDYGEILHLLRRYGYTSFKLVDQSLNPALGCPYPPLEGRFVNTGFLGHMSGPFGEEASGIWADLEKAEDEIKNANWQQGHWYDIHASLAH